jgi:hypothetical protein
VSILSNLLNPPKSSGSLLSIQVIGLSVPATNNSDITSVVRAHLQGLKTEIKAAMGSIPGEMSKYHLQDILVRIDNALNPKD